MKQLFDSLIWHDRPNYFQQSFSYICVYTFLLLIIRPWVGRSVELWCCILLCGWVCNIMGNVSGELVVVDGQMNNLPLPIYFSSFWNGLCDIFSDVMRVCVYKILWSMLLLKSCFVIRVKSWARVKSVCIHCLFINVLEQITCISYFRSIFCLVSIIFTPK